MDRVLVVGHGYAGRRFVTALRHLADTGVPVELVGVCDRNPVRLPADVAGFTDLAEALRVLSPSVVCVTVNEAEHIAVYERLRHLPRALVISEKPLTGRPHDLPMATASLAGHVFAMNLVERFSPVVREYRAWAARQDGLEVVRAEAFWGKHRVGDPRPTVGVLSELIHPLDLVRYLFGVEELRVLGGYGVESDFSPHAPVLLDSVDVYADMAGAPVLLHSSFAWPARQRLVTALLWSVTAGMLRVELEFDSPHWDCDRLDVLTVGPDGHWEPLLHLSTDVTDLPAPIRGVGKVVRFIESALRTWRGEPAEDEQVNLGVAVRLQEITDEIDHVIARQGVPARYRRAGTPAGIRP